MSTTTGVIEHWTITGRRVVLTGDEKAIWSIATQLGLPDDSMIQLGGSRVALALWGQPLTRYLNQCRVQDPPPQLDVLISSAAL